MPTVDLSPWQRKVSRSISLPILPPSLSARSGPCSGGDGPSESACLCRKRPEELFKLDIEVAMLATWRGKLSMSESSGGPHLPAASSKATQPKGRAANRTYGSNGASRDVAVQTRWTWCTALGSRTPLVLRQDGIMGAVECRSICMQRAPWCACDSHADS